MTTATRKHRYRINGREVTRKQFIRGRTGGRGLPEITKTYQTERPLRSIGLSCHREQAEEYNEAAKDLGLTGIEWDQKGDCSITSRKDRAKWLRANRLHDQDGCYSDG